MVTKGKITTSVLLVVAFAFAGLGGTATATHTTSTTNLYFHKGPTGIGNVDLLLSRPMDTTAPTGLVPGVVHATPLVSGANPQTPWEASWRSVAPVNLQGDSVRFVWWVASANQGLLSSDWQVSLWETSSPTSFTRIATADASFATPIGEIPVELSYTLTGVSTSGNLNLVAMIDAGSENDAASVILYDSVSTPSRLEISPPNLAPTADIQASGTAARNANVHFNGTASSDADGTIVSYAWDFGDGDVGSGALVKHKFSAAGTYAVTLTVTDDDGATGSTTHTIVIT